jgi:Rha family phage regulatory protein
MEINQELVISNNGRTITTSLLVAKKFNKRHEHVLRTIRNLIKDDPKMGSHVAEGRYFCESTYINEQNKAQPMYYIDREGFSLQSLIVNQAWFKNNHDSIRIFGFLPIILRARRKRITNDSSSKGNSLINNP